MWETIKALSARHARPCAGLAQARARMAGTSPAMTESRRATSWRRLVNAHEKLDRAVAAAYGWPENISTEEALAKPLEPNLQRPS